MTTTPRSNAVSRSEFEQFERAVVAQFGEMRDAIGGLGKKLDSIAVKANRPTDWRAVFGGVSMMATIIIAIGSIIAWGLTERINGVVARATEMAAEHNDRFLRVEGVVERGLFTIDEKMVRMTEDRWSRRNQMDFVEPRLQALEARLREIEKENP